MLSASVLLGKAGVKLVFHRGLDIDAAVYVTNGFKASQPGLTGLLREACAHGWLACKANELKGRGRKPSLLLRGDAEVVQGFKRTRVKSLSGVDFVRWVTKTCLNQGLSARVSAAV